MAKFKKTKGGHLVSEPKRPPRNYQKAFGLSTFIASTLKSYENENEPEIAQLQLQCKRLMNVYSVEGGLHHFEEMTDKLGDIWAYLLTRNENNAIKEDDVPALVECMCMIIPPKDFKDMFGVDPYIRDRHMYYQSYPIIVNNVLELDKELNSLLGTKPYALMKPKEKAVKVKKTRDKSKKKTNTNIKPKKNVKLIQKKKEAKANNLEALRARIAQAKQKVEVA